MAACDMLTGDGDPKRNFWFRCFSPLRSVERPPLRPLSARLAWESRLSYYHGPQEADGTGLRTTSQGWVSSLPLFQIAGWGHYERLRRF